MISKRFIATAMCALTLFAFGCKKQEAELPTDRNYETFIGEIKSLGGIKVNKNITHLFETEDGEILYAYSDRYDLNNPDFRETSEAYGVVLVFETLDKDVFEIRRITEPPEEDAEDESAEDLPYKNLGLGISLNYPSNWTLTEFVDYIRLDSPVEEEGEIEPNPDYILVSRLDANLTTTSEDDLSVQASEVRTYVRDNYESLIGVGNDLSSVGVDGLFSIRYKTVTGDISYFIPRGTDLYEISFIKPLEGERLSISNIFAEIVSSFRFLPFDEEEDITEEPVEEPEEETVVEIPTTSSDPIVITNLRYFESNPFKFKISYPANWYYSGGNNGYDFADEPIEDDTKPLVRLDLNTTTVTGTSRSGNNISVTVKVADRFYTLTGDGSFESLMQTMADSIEPTADDEQ